MRATRFAVAASLVTASYVGLGAAPVSAATPGDECKVGITRYVPGFEKAASLTSVGFRQSWRVATGKGVTVAVVDSGVNVENAHLGKAVLDGTSFVGGSPDGKEDLMGHGTATAGIIAAGYVKGSALVGAAYDAKILPVRVYTEEPATPTVARGIRWAADHDADVINVSISTGASDPAVPALRSAVDYAQRKGALVVTSGGNQSEDADLTQERFPAAIKGALGVAAADTTGAVNGWSIHGPHNDVSAPGENLIATFHGNGDCIIGTDHPFTSWATAYVSALAAQLMEKYPNDSPEQISNRITSTADRPQLSKRDDKQGWGLIQPYIALTASSNSSPGAASPQGPKADNDKDSLVVGPEEDPLGQSRSTMLWLSIAALGITGVAVILRPLVTRKD